MSTATPPVAPDPRASAAGTPSAAGSSLPDAAAAHSLHDLRAVLDHVPAMIGYWDRNLRNRFGNCAYKTWFGIEPEQMPGMHIRDVIGEERYRLNLPFIEAALRGEEQVFERVIPVPEDHTKLRYSFAHYIPDWVDGVVQGFYVLVSDITPIKEIEAAYQASEARYRAVLMDQTELISRFSQDGRYLFVNEAYCRFFGKQESELLGQHWAPVVLAEDLPLVAAKLREMSPEQPVVTVENRVYSATGEVRWLQFVNRGFYAVDGELCEIQSIGRDITDRKNAEDALRQAHAEMEQRVVERTEQLRNLAVEATLAEERERLAIARDLHDELGQLLHIAKIKFDTLAKTLAPEQRPAVSELDVLLADASRQVRSLTTQLTPPVLRKLGLAAALRWLAEEMERQYGLQVACSCGELPAGILLTPAQETILFRAVRELLINVHKHAGTAHASVAASLCDGVLTVVVADAGAGMENLPAALQRSDAFGLLSIRERILYLGGSTEIDSAPGRGMRVTIRMPVLPPHQPFTGEAA